MLPQTNKGSEIETNYRHENMERNDANSSNP